MSEFILVRHGETEWNKIRRIMGRKPIPLNDTGRGQIADLRAYLATTHIDIIYTSPVLRTRESAEILAADRDIPLYEDEGLAEINYGPWVDMYFQDVQAQPEFVDYFKRPSQVQIPGGESMQAVVQRVTALIERLRREHAGKRLLLVSHADVIKVALVHYLNLHLDEMHRMRIDNGSHSMLSFFGDYARVLIVNGLAKLDGFYDKGSLFQTSGIPVSKPA